MDLITLERVRQFAPGCPLAQMEIIAGQLAFRAEAFGVTTPVRLHHFMAQVAHESMGLVRLEENLSYSAKRLTQVWPSRFPTLAAALPYERRPFKLAEKAYSGRMGNSKPGDGWRYRGRGLIMLTGHDNYAEAEEWSGLPLKAHPDLAAEPSNAAELALAYWRHKGCNMLADLNDLEGVTELINGGQNGLEDRARWLAKARKAFR